MSYARDPDRPLGVQALARALLSDCYEQSRRFRYGVRFDRYLHRVVRFGDLGGRATRSVGEQSTSAKQAKRTDKRQVIDQCTSPN